MLAHPHRLKFSRENARHLNKRKQFLKPPLFLDLCEDMLREQGPPSKLCMSTRQHLWTAGDCLACNMCHPFWTQTLWWHELQSRMRRWSIARSAACWSVPNTWIKMHFNQRRRKTLFSFGLLQPSVSGSYGFISAAIFTGVQCTDWFAKLPGSLFRGGRF